MTGVFDIFYENNAVIKLLNKNSDIGKKINLNLKNIKHLTFFNKEIKYSYKKIYIGKHINIGYLYGSRGNYASPIINGILLSDLDINSLSNNQKYHLIYSLQDLLSNLILYKRKEKNLTGDWTFHNLIWNNQNGNIVNIDLEGFYTYSDYGPELDWVKVENKLNFIKKNIKDLQKRIILKIKKNFIIIKKIPYLSIIYLPCKSNVQLFYPLLFKNNSSNINDKIFLLDFGDKEGYNTSIFNVYFSLNKSDKVSCIIYPNYIKQNNYNLHFIYVFSFEAVTTKGYEHPIPIKLLQKKNPIRTIMHPVLDEDVENIECDFYVKKFIKYKEK